MEENPSWRVREMLMVGPFGWQAMSAAEIAKVHARLSGTRAVYVARNFAPVDGTDEASLHARR